MIFLEDQYLWSAEIVSVFARALEANPELRFVAVIPLHPDQDGRISEPPNLIGRLRAMQALFEAGGQRVAFYGAAEQRADTDLRACQGRVSSTTSGPASARTT